MSATANAIANRRPLRGRTALITGATAGIGYETARALACSGARVLVTGRDPANGERATATLARDCGADSAAFLRADHGTVGGNQDLADRVRATVARLDVLVNNVGGLYSHRQETADGYEATLAMNFVGPYTLTAELLPLLTEGGPSRCVNVVSAGFKMWKTDPFTDLHSTDQFVSGDAYAHTKLLNVLASLAWARRLAPDNVTVNLVHPGMSWTPMTASMTAQTIPSMRLIWPVLRFWQRHASPVKAGRRVAFVASSSDTAAYTGRYFEGRAAPNRLSERELDLDNQDLAWTLGEELMTTAPTHHDRQTPGRKVSPR
jgi:NAD(P)-dependent dehydrogenase (short-subunit alcohol dehydrogenase family)